MLGVTLDLEGKETRERLQRKQDDGLLVDLTGNNATVLGIAVVEGSMSSGKPSVMLHFDLPNGETLVLETSAALLVMAAAAIRTRYEMLQT